MELQKTLTNTDRNVTIDIFRGIAILGVVFYHFKHILPFGFIGVDLFFVISGFLVGGLLFKDYEQKKHIKFTDFFIRRSFKILPSYYFFLIVGGILAFMIYGKTNPELLPANWWSYIFFTVNFRLADVPGYHEWLFSQAWSLCVEEHFYLLLPFIFIFVQRFGNRYTLIASVVGLILTGIISKILIFYFTVKQDSYFPTYTRIDALAWGVLMNIFLNSSTLVKDLRFKILTFIVAFIFFIAAVKFYYNGPAYYKMIIFHSILPVLFCIMISSLYYVDLSFKLLRPLRIIGYYSYNWYLWHTSVAWIVIAKMGTGKLALVVYLVVSFLLAVLWTTIIEEPFLKLRKKIFSSRAKASLAYESVPAKS